MRSTYKWHANTYTKSGDDIKVKVNYYHKVHVRKDDGLHIYSPGNLSPQTVVDMSQGLGQAKQIFCFILATYLICMALIISNSIHAWQIVKPTTIKNGCVWKAIMTAQAAGLKSSTTLHGLMRICDLGQLFLELLYIPVNAWVIQ